MPREARGKAPRTLAVPAALVDGQSAAACNCCYFGWVLRTAGLDHGAVASSCADIEEARRARGQAEARAHQLRAAEEALERVH